MVFAQEFLIAKAKMRADFETAVWSVVEFTHQGFSTRAKGSPKMDNQMWLILMDVAASVCNHGAYICTYCRDVIFSELAVCLNVRYCSNVRY